MPSVGYATLQVIPSMRGIGADIRRQLGVELGPVGRQVGSELGDGLGDGLVRGADGRLRDMRGRFAAEGRRQGQTFGDTASRSVSKSMLAGLAGLAVGAGAVLTQGLQDAIGQMNAATTLQAQLGSTNGVAAAQGKIAGKLYGSGVSGSFQEAADAIKAVVQAGLAPPDATNAQLQRIATKASDVANVFGQDLGGVTSAVSQMMRTGLASSSREAFDLITRGFQTGTDKGGDFLDTINEYGTQFRKAGLDGSTAIGLLNQAIRAGARDSDVAADAIKEFSIRAVDGSKSTVSGFKALGLNADSMASKFAKGGKSANSVLDLTLDKLRGVEDPVKRSQIAVQLFGTQAEDLGDALLAMDPSKAASGLGKVGGAASRMGKTLRSGPSHEIEVFKRAVSQTFVNFLGGTVLPILARVGGWVNTNLIPPLRTAASVIGPVLGAAFRAIGSAISGTVNWLRQFGVWLVPAGIAVAGLTVTMQAQRIATAATSAVFAVYRGVLVGWAAVQRGATAAQLLFNAALRANPIGLIITAVLALGAVFVIAYQRVGWFRTAVNAAWSGIKVGALFLWNSVLKPMFAGLMVGFRAIGTVAMWLWTNVLSPVFRFIWTAAKVLMTVVVVAVVLPIVVAFKLLAAVAKWLWTNALAPAFRGIGRVALWLYRNIIAPQFALMRAAFRLVGAIARWLYNNAIKPAMGWIATRVMWVVTRTKAAWAIFKVALMLVGVAFRRLYNAYVRPVMGWIGSRIKTVWVNLIRPAFDAVKKGVGLVGTAFSKAKDWIGKQWSKLASIARKPIAFIVNTVYNRGIVPVWNKVAGAFGAPKLSKAKGFAEGGYTGDGGKYTPAGVVHAGEYVIPKAQTARIGLPALEHMRSTGKLPGYASGGLVGGMPGYAKGGIVDTGWGWIKNAASSAWDKVKQGARWLKETIKGSALAGFDKLVKPLMAKIAGSSSMYKSMVTRIPKKMISSIFSWSGTADKKLAAAGIVGGGGYAKGLRWARTQHGKRYQWGGNGNPSWDCSGFLSAIESVIRGQRPHRRWATGIFPPGAPGWRRNARSPFRIGITNAGVGHTAGTLNGVNVESRGGDGVVVGRRARGYNSGMFTSRWGFVGKYDSGGWLQPGMSTVMNATGQPEAVLTGPQWRIAQSAMSQQTSGPSEFSGNLYLEGGEFLGKVRGVVRQENAAVVSALGARAGR